MVTPIPASTAAETAAPEIPLAPDTPLPVVTLTPEEEEAAFQPTGLTINSYYIWETESRQGYETVDGYYMEETSGCVTLYYVRQAAVENTEDSLRLVVIQNAPDTPEPLTLLPNTLVESVLGNPCWDAVYTVGEMRYRELLVLSEKALLRMGAYLPAGETDTYMDSIEEWLESVYTDDDTLAEHGSGIFSDGSVIGDYVCHYDAEALPYWQEMAETPDDTLLHLENADGGILTVRMGEASGLTGQEHLAGWVETMIEETYDAGCSITAPAPRTVGKWDYAGYFWQVDYPGDSLWRELHVTVMIEEKWCDLCCTLQGDAAEGLFADFEVFLSTVVLEGTEG